MVVDDDSMFECMFLYGCNGARDEFVRLKLQQAETEWKKFNRPGPRTLQKHVLETNDNRCQLIDQNIGKDTFSSILIAYHALIIFYILN